MDRERIATLAVVAAVAIVGITTSPGTAMSTIDLPVQDQSETTGNGSNSTIVTAETTTTNSNVSTVTAETATIRATTGQRATGTQSTATDERTTRGENATESTTSAAGSTPPAEPTGIRFTLPSQSSDGSSVIVEAPKLPSGGFLVIHDSRYPDNGFGSIIGVSEYIPPDSAYRRVEVRLFDVPGRSFEQSQLRASTTLYARAALDTNNNQQYDYLATGGAEDVSYLINGSRIAVDAARVSIDPSIRTEAPAAEYGIETSSTTRSGSGATPSVNETSEADGGNLSDEVAGPETLAPLINNPSFASLLVVIGGLVAVVLLIRR